MTFDFKGAIGLVSDDSRELKEGVTFLATEQNRVFHNEVLKRGSSFTTPKKLINNLELNDIEIVGITGTNGKTTTAAAIYSTLIELEYGCALQGTRGFFINDYRVKEKSLTTPSILETIHNIFEAKKRGCDFFVMEVSSHAIAQNRIEGLNYSLKIHTNVTSDHLDFHKTIEAYRRVKSSFFQDDTRKLINRDDTALNFNPRNAYGYGIENSATYKIMAYSLNNGISAVIKNYDTVVPFESCLRGFFNLYNITAAIAAVHILTNEELAEVCEAAENFGGVCGRMEVVSENPLIIVDFAHTTDGIKQVLDSFKGNDIKVVLGAGGDRDKSKRPKMAKVAALGAKKVYLTSDNPRYEDPVKIVEEMASGIDSKDKFVKIVDRKKAIEKAVKELNKDEVLLVLGKGDEEWQEVYGKKIPFSDKDIIKEVLLRIKGD